MKHSSLSSLPALALLLGTLTLVGCGGALNIPDSVASSSAAAGPAVSGAMYGGHAPIAGAHVYLLQPSITAYGGLATSILGNNGATSSNGYAITANVNDPNVPVGANYETTDSSGGFNFTGAYTCQVGQPVYIYGYGGNIGATASSTTTTTTVTLTITAASVVHNGNVYTYTFTAANGGAHPLVANDPVTLTLHNAGGGANWTNLDGPQTVATASGTNFTLTQTGNEHASGSATGTAVYTYTTTTTTTNPAINNNSIVQLLTLGNCPSSGSFSGSSALSFVYLNEVSTIATAYTFQPFTLLTNNDAWHIGTDGTPQALLGIANAANTAAQLYNIEGATTLISSSGDGEGHLANNVTANGNGIVPQATIDSLANIVANCVDSVPTTVGTPTTQCTALFSVATDDGTTTGTQPVDTGTAAINIARFPAGNNSSANVNTAYASTIWALQGTGTVPYVPDLNAAPNDWTIAINYPVAGRPYSTSYSGVTNPYFALAESLSIDDLGQIWVTGQGDTSIVRLDNLGVIQPATAQTYLTYIPGYVSVDGNNNAWTGSATSSTPIFEAGANGVFTATYGTANQFTDAYVNIADNAGNDYFFAKTTGNYEMFEYPVGSTTATTPTAYSLATSGFGANNVAHGAIDANHDFWLTSEAGNYQIAKVTATGTNVWLINTHDERPEFPSIDANGTGWIPNQAAAGPIYKITSAGASTSLTSGTTGATLSYPFGSAVDGNGNVWITNRCGPYNDCSYPSSASSTLIELNGTGTTTPGTINTAISPPTNYLPETQYPATATTFTAIMPDPLNIAIDPSGNIWITNYTGVATTGSLVEIVGAAAPVVTPLSAAAGATPTSKLGAKP